MPPRRASGFVAAALGLRRVITVITTAAGLDVVIRVRNPGDDAAIRCLNDQAFGGAYESKLIDDLRAARLAEIELVAIEQTAIVGHILFSMLAVTFGADPCARLPWHRWRSNRPARSGIGDALVRAGLERARSDDWQAVIVLGHRPTIRASVFPQPLPVPSRAIQGRWLHGTGTRSRRAQGQRRPCRLPPAFGIEPG